VLCFLDLIVNFGELKVETKRKVKDFDENFYRMGFDVLILNILLILSKKSLLKT
jgi:hypothetical protein